MPNIKGNRSFVIFALIGLGILLRVLPHPPNWTPVTSMALLSGAYLGRRWMAFLVPLLVMIVSDLVYGFHESLLFVYGSFALIVWLGFSLSSEKLMSKKGFGQITQKTLLASVLFFLVTNFGIWWTSGLYSYDFSGLIACFTLAIPFFGPTLSSAIVYSFVFFGLYQLAADKLFKEV